MRHLLSTICTVGIFNAPGHLNIARFNLTGSYFPLYIFLKKGILVLSGFNCVILRKLLPDGIPDVPSYIDYAFVFKDDLLALDSCFRLKKA